MNIENYDVHALIEHLSDRVDALLLENVSTEDLEEELSNRGVWLYDHEQRDISSASIDDLIEEFNNRDESIEYLPSLIPNITNLAESIREKMNLGKPVETDIVDLVELITGKFVCVKKEQK